MDAEAARSSFPTAVDRAQDRKRKKEAVLIAAVTMFNEHGFRATSLDEVASYLGVTKPAIYHYFRNKEEVLFQCFRMGLKRLDAAVLTARDHPGTALERLKALLTGYIKVITADFGMCLVRTDDQELSAEGTREFRFLKRSIDREFRCQIEQAISSGSIDVPDVRLAAFTIAGALNWIPRWYRPDGDYDLDEISSGMIDLLLHGMVNSRAEADNLDNTKRAPG